MEDYNIFSYDSFNFYYKGTFENLEIWNNGWNDFVKRTPVDLFLKDGTFYKTEHVKEYKNMLSDVLVSKYNIQYNIIQIDYKLYKIPIIERLSIYEGRFKLMNMLKCFGVSGFINYNEDMPLECSFVAMNRVNTKSFINFDYNEYINEINSFMEKNKCWEKEIINLRESNLYIICKFYNIKKEELPKIKLNRLKYAIRALNIKINNKLKNN